jgi:hypothetical protein
VDWPDYGFNELVVNGMNDLFLMGSEIKIMYKKIAERQIRNFPRMCLEELKKIMK